MPEPSTPEIQSRREDSTRSLFRFGVESWLVPAVLRRRRQDRARATLLVVASFALAGAVGTAWLVRAWVAKLPLASHVALAAAVLLFAAIPFVIRVHGDLDLAGRGLVAILVTITFVVGLQNGGTEAPALVLLFITPVVATFLLGSRAGVVALVAGSLVAMSLHAIHVLGLEPETTLTGEALRYARLSATILASVAGAVLAIGYETVTRQSARELHRAEQKASAAARAKSDFVANVSHEIRTPLNVITGATELLQEADLGVEQRHVVGRVAEAARHLRGLVGDVLDFARIEAGTLAIQRDAVDVRALIASVEADFSSRAGAKALAFQTEVLARVPEHLELDALRARQVLSNLIDNAIKFTDQGSVRVEVDWKPEGETLRLSVIDTGPGFPESFHDQLFEEFSQADRSGSRMVGGVGLGLAISKRLTEVMGGELTAMSVEDEGSVFSAHLPAARASAANADVTELLAGGNRELPTGRVLVVEDDLATRWVISAQLAALGQECRVVESGREAQEELQRHTYDLVLMDCQLPGMDGFETTRLLRRLESGGNRRTPIVAVTASVVSGEDERYLAGGMDDVLSKPVKIPELVATLERWLSRESGPAAGDSGTASDAVEP